MNGLTNYVTQRPWLDAITAGYVWVEDAYRAVVQSQPVLTRRSGPPPKFTDSEDMTVGLIIETFFHGQEEVGYAFVAQYLRAAFPHLLDLDRLNARRRDLMAVVEAIRRHLRDRLVDRADPLRLVDSALCRRVPGTEHFGVVTSKKAKVFG